MIALYTLFIASLILLHSTSTWSTDHATPLSRFAKQQCIIKKFGYIHASSKSLFAVADSVDPHNTIYIYARNNISHGPFYEVIPKPGIREMAFVNDTHLVSAGAVENGLWIDAVNSNASTNNIKLPDLATKWCNLPLQITALQHIPNHFSVAFMSNYRATILDIVCGQISRTIEHDNEEISKMTPDKEGSGLWYLARKQFSPRADIRYYDLRSKKSMNIMEITYDVSTIWSVSPNNNYIAIVNNTDRLTSSPISLFDITAQKLMSTIVQPVHCLTTNLFFLDNNHLIHNTCTKNLYNYSNQVLCCTRLNPISSDSHQLPLKREFVDLCSHPHTGIVIGYQMKALYPIGMTIYDGNPQ